jgi:hypothetical protein
MMPREHRSQENQLAAPSGRDVQVTVTTTIECDIESRWPVDESIPELPSRMKDFHPLELTEEEQQIRALEYQMKQDLDI